MAESKADAEALVPRFQLERVLNQDQAGRRMSLVGTINGKPAILILERAPFPSSKIYVGSVTTSLAKLRNLGANDIYRWYMARSGQSGGGSDDSIEDEAEGIEFYADLKINLIYPCTEAHIKKYSKQGVRFVTETPEIYRDHVRPYMQRKREQGRLNWVYNIIEGRTEVEDVMFRTKLGESGDQGFLLLPDLNWDRKTIDALHVLGIVERRDIWSLRDLKKKHIPWLASMKEKLIAATVETYPTVERDQLKLYVHYQPTYYHFHIHVVHVALEAGVTQATGKAIGLDSIIETLGVMRSATSSSRGVEEGDDEEVGMDAMAMSYSLGEASELWQDIFEPLKSGSKPSRLR